MTRRKIGFLCVVATLIALTAWLGVATPRQALLPSFAADDTDPYYIDSEATFEYFVNSCVSMIETDDPDNPEVEIKSFPYAGRTVVLETDLYFDRRTEGYGSVRFFGGTFVGNGHTLVGWQGDDLFGTLSAGASVSDLNLADVKNPVAVVAVNDGTVSGIRAEGAGYVRLR